MISEPLDKDLRVHALLIDEDKYLSLRIIEMKPKTSVYGIFSKLHGDKLGEVRWFGRWRQYCFFPAKDTVFNRECMETIKAYLDYLYNARHLETGSP